MARQIGVGLGRDLAEVRVSLFRPNLMYAVHKLRNREEKIERLIDICRREQGSGIVYVGSRKDAESLAATLRDRGVHAIPYHAGLEKEIRAANQERFMTGRARVVVATIAFGMGIDKADVRFIVHFAPPDSLEAYAQESGRAGRDGKPARCILLATNSDGTKLKTFAHREEMKIDTLRTVYGVIKRQANGNWAVVDPRRLELAVAPEDEVGSPYESRVDPRVALGILEQAGLLIRHPDAPITYSAWTDGDIRRNHNPLAGPEERFGNWLLQQSLPGAIFTAEACAHSGLTPFELDRVLFQRQDLSVRGGQRGIALQLLPPPSDIGRRMESLLDKARANADRRIDQMISYINARQCRHSILVAHLGERLEPCGESCDVCRGETATRQDDQMRTHGGALKHRAPTPDDALVVLRAAGSLPFPMGKTGLTKLLLGSAESRVREDRAPLFGALRELSKGDVERLIDRLVEYGFLHRDLDHEYKLITVTRGGKSATLEDLAGVERPARPPAPSIVAGSRQDDRYERLTEWRRRKIEEESVPGYVIATNATLTELATDPPKSLDDLRRIRGFGPKRIEKYGEEILELLANEPA
jgi:ATP-dependent DNA helicase RecQ